jgi:hypothetical protein
MKTYCSACGFKIEYQSNQKPNFCPKCGFSFKEGSSAKSQEDEESHAEAEEAPKLGEDFELEFEIMEKPQKSNKLSDLAGSSEGAPRETGQSKKGRGRPKEVKNEDVWRQFKEEAGGSPHKEKNKD